MELLRVYHLDHYGKVSNEQYLFKEEIAKSLIRHAPELARVEWECGRYILYRRSSFYSYEPFKEGQGPINTFPTANDLETKGGAQ